MINSSTEKIIPSPKQKMMTWFDKTVDIICKPSRYANELKKMNEDGS